jgi:membrane-bound lytic murein transglycosylase D
MVFMKWLLLTAPLLLTFCTHHQPAARVIANDEISTRELESFDQSESAAESSASAARNPLLAPISSGKAPKTELTMVNRWIEFFAKKDRGRFQRYLDRAMPYRSLVREIFDAHGVPGEMFYLGIVESGYLTHARSSASAVGVWQFIKETGQRYGLKVNPYVDERKDIIRSTDAAAKYLKDLHNVFNSWELALAAYNSGEGRVLRAVMRGNTRDYWELIDKGMLPDETANYVPKFLAIASIGERSKHFGYVNNHPPVVRPRILEVPGGVRLSDLAEKANVPVESLQYLNPHLIRGITPPSVDRYAVWVPKDQETALKIAAEQVVVRKPAQFAPVVASQNDVVKDRAQLPGLRKGLALGVRELSPTKTVTVQKGDTLTSLAEQHRTTVISLKRLNNIRGDHLSLGGRIVVPSNYKGPAKSLVKYKVKRGDSLISIADRFGTTVQTLQSINSLERDTVYAGEVLQIKSSGRGI